tara:strand:- start:2988 stop:3737 length:750 start_codon:yes stop_codon:yes gene_type:complete
MERVWIFGDSFADPNWEKERYVHETWYEKLEKQYDEYHNFAFAGTGPHYSFKEFYKRYESFNEDDLIVFILSGQDRINFYVSPTSDDRADVYKSHEAEWDFNNHKMNFNNSEDFDNEDEERMTYAMQTFEQEVLNLNKKNESFLYTISRLNKCKICIFFLRPEESYIGDRLNDTNFYIHKDGLAKACEDEYINPGEPYVEYNKRNNHMVEENHIVLYEIIDNFVKGNTNIPSFKKHLIDAPDKREFIYD